MTQLRNLTCDLRAAELFAGIGGFSLGLEWAGITTAWQCEIDPYCQTILEKHWPDIPVYKDVRQLKGDECEKVQILAGGFPCQGVSSAGRGKGLDDPRSGLWSEFARLVGELAPRWVVVENVAALKAKGRGLGRVLADLAALGYDAEWDCLPASAFGAPHQRDRIWIVAYPQRSELRQQQGWSSRQSRAHTSQLAIDGSTRSAMRAATYSVTHSGGRQVDAQLDGQTQSHTPNRNSCGAHTHRLRDALADPPGSGRKRRSGPSHATRDSGQFEDGRSAWTSESGIRRVAPRVPSRVDRLTALGNALVPQIAEWIGRRIVEYEHAHS